MSMTDGSGKSLKEIISPGENIRFESPYELSHDGRSYTVIVTDRRLILHCKGGMVERERHEVYSLDEIKDVHFKKKGLLGRTATVEIEGKTKILLEGDAPKALKVYEALKQFKQTTQST